MTVPVEGRPPADDVSGWDDLAAVLAGLLPVEHRAVTSVYFEGRTFRETAALLKVDEIVVSRAIASAHRPVARHVMTPETTGATDRS